MKKLSLHDTRAYLPVQYVEFEDAFTWDFLFLVILCLLASLQWATVGDYTLPALFRPKYFIPPVLSFATILSHLVSI